MNPDPPHVLRVADLRRALNEVLDEVERTRGAELDVLTVPYAGDYYWQLDVQTAFALDDEPGLRVSAGQTHDDLATLDEILAEPDEPVLSHSLAHLAELLRFLAFASNPRPGALRPSDRDR